MTDNTEPTIDDILTDYYRKTVRVDGNTPNSRQEATQAIYEALAKEAKHLIMSDGIRRKAVPLSKIKEMFGVGDDNS